MYNLLASNRPKQQEDIKLRVLRLLEDNPNMSTRQIAKLVGISNGSTYYCIKALIKKGFIKIGNFSASNNKRKYIYIITPAGIYEKTLLTANFLKRKVVEYNNLKNEIKQLEEELNKSKKEENSFSKQIY